MAYTDPAFSTQQAAQPSHPGTSASFEATDGGALALPHAGWTADAEMLRDGPDLILKAPDGSQAVVHGYFTADPPPTLQGPDGTSLTPALVDSFVHDAGPVRYAATDTATDASPVGRIEEMEGTATITRTDGTKDAAAPGAPVYQGDVIETGAQGSVNIVFADETSFAVSENARLAIDEYVYDPSSESGQTHFSVLRGVFVFTSGLVGRDDPDDVKIETPMGSIGIRGTIIAGNLNSGEITVVEGAIVLRAPDGAEITLADQFDTARFTSAGAVEHLGILNAGDLAARFAGLSAVVPDFFGAIGAQPPAPDGDGSTQTPGDTLDGKPAQDTDGQTPAQGDTPQGSIDQPLDAKPTQDGAAQPSPDGAAPADPALADGQTGPLLPPPPPPGSFSTLLTGETIQPYFQTAPAPFAPPPGFMPPPPQGTLLPPPPPPPVYTAPTGTYTATDPNAGTLLPPPPPPGGTTGGSTNPPPPLDLGIGGSSGVVQIAATGGAGLSVAGLGDRDNDGRAEVAFVGTGAAGGQMAIFEWDPANKAFTPMSSLNLGLSVATGELGGFNLVSLGDVNRDGTADFAGGAPQADLTPFTDTGDFRIFNGANPGTYRALDSSSLWLDSAEKYGHGLAGAGDVNNDGIADILIGAPYEDTGSGPRGAAFLLFGGNAFFSGGTVDPSAIGLQGITLTGATTNALLGDSVASAGDFNDDGIGDFLVGAPGEDAAYVLFGKASTTGWAVNLGALGADGIKISGASGSDLGSGLALAGDMNGDGRSDIVLAAEGENKVHVVYGTAGASSMSVASLNGANGFTVDGANGEGLSIRTGGAVGDFNGDGRDDFALVLGDGSHNEIYVVYGRDSMPATLTLADLRQSNVAFRMVWDGFDGESLSITAAGDVTGDGRNDMLIGSPLANGGSGSVLMVEGRGPQTINPGNVLGTFGADADIVTGVSNARINAGAGNDFIRVTGAAGPSVQLIDGGAGFDTLRLENANMSLDFSRSSTAQMAGIEKIVFEGIGQTLKLGLEDVFQLMQQSADHTLRIVEGAGGAGTFQIDNNKNNPSGEGLLTTTPVHTALGMAYAGTDTITDPGVTYNKYTFGGYTLLVDQNVDAAVV